MILKANVVKEAKLEELSKKVCELKQQPKLSIIMVGDSSASKVYVKNKIKFAQDIGVLTNLIHLDEKVSEEEIIKVIEEENNNDKTNGLFVQLPVPKHIDEKKNNRSN